MDVVVTDHDGREIEWGDHNGLAITPRLNGYVEVAATLDPSSRGAAAVAIARRAIKVYDDGALRFFGQIWEPLTRKREAVSLVARSPLATFAWRRVQTLKDYTATNNAGGPWDAGAIARDRVAIQNARRNTFLRATVGNTQTSVNRIRSYQPGKREDEILAELADAADGFFYREAFVDDVAGVMADLLIRYPDAGLERPEVRFEYGAGTLDNVNDYEHVELLPRNRIVAAGAADAGGRITQTREDAASQSLYGLFEDELAYTEQTSTDLLLQAAAGAVRPEPVLTVQIQPGPDAPLVYRDFDVGDFVRLRILERPAATAEEPEPAASIDLETWARVAEATLTEDANGIQTLGALVLELEAGSVDISPARLFRARQDDERRRLEALERRVEQLNVAAVDPPDNTGSSGGGDDGGGVPDEPPEPPPAPEPPSAGPPSISGLGGYGSSTRSIHVEVDVAENGAAATTYIHAETGGIIRAIVGPFYGSGHHAAELEGLARNTSYTIVVNANSSAGNNADSTTIQTLNVDPI